MMLECPTCDHFIVVPNGKFKPDHTFQADCRCNQCGSIYAVEVRELRATEHTPEWISARKNRPS